MMKGTIQNLRSRLRLVKFSKEFSPNWVNEGQGWTSDLAVTAASALGLKADKVSESDTQIMYRVQPPRLGKLKSKELIQGLEVVCDA